ncbi:MAG TPA: hypothetical protein VGG75_13245 [Trebonia sp.]
MSYRPGIEPPDEPRAGQVDLCGQRAERPRLGETGAQKIGGGNGVAADDTARCLWGLVVC